MLFISIQSGLQSIVYETLASNSRTATFCRKHDKTFLLFTEISI